MYAMKALASPRVDRAVAFYGMVRVPAQWQGGGQGDAIDVVAARAAQDDLRLLCIFGTEDPWCPLGLDEGGRVLGLFADADYGEGEVRIGPGGRLTLFTDGVTEAENARNEEFGDGRLVELLAGNRTLSCPDLHARLMEAVVGFAGGLSDDATLLTLAANR
jgi:hypothetical protein